MFVLAVMGAGALSLDALLDRSPLWQRGPWRSITAHP
jgi:hypothetical protein